MMNLCLIIFFFEAVEDYYYTLRDVIFFLENAQLPLGEYRRKVVESKVAPIVEQDRGPLQKYMTGELDSCAQIDVAMQSSYKAPTRSHSTAAPPKKAEVAPVASEKEKVESLVPATSGADAVVEEKQDKRSDRKRKADKIQVASTVSQCPQSFISQALASVPGSSREIIDEDKAVMARIRSEEYAPNNRNSVMNVQGGDFSLALKLFNDKILKPLHQTGLSAPSTTSIPPSVAAVSAAPSATQGPPRSLIILVPNSLTGKRIPVILLSPISFILFVPSLYV